MFASIQTVNICMCMEYSVPIPHGRYCPRLQLIKTVPIPKDKTARGTGTCPVWQLYYEIYIVLCRAQPAGQVCIPSIPSPRSYPASAILYHDDYKKIHDTTLPRIWEESVSTVAWL